MEQEEKNSSKEGGEEVSLPEEERRRYNFLIDRGNESYERLERYISSLNNRNISLIGINLALITIILTVLPIVFEKGWNITKPDIFLLVSVLILLSVSLIINLFIFHPTDYKDLEIFEEKRFYELTGMDEETLLSEILYCLKDAFEYNDGKYTERTRWFIKAFKLFITADAIIVLLIIKNIVFFYVLKCYIT